MNRLLPRIAHKAAPSLILCGTGVSGRRLLSALPSTSFEDPSRPGLFYHLLEESSTSPVYAISFLKEIPTAKESRTILGYLPAASESAESQTGLDDFVPNTAFLEVLHTAVRKGLASGRDEAIKADAVQRASGWLHINDMRNVPALGRIGDPDDILGTVLIEDGTVIASSYQRMPSYRLCTADGVTQLSEGLSSALMEELDALHKSEKARPSDKPTISPSEA